MGLAIVESFHPIKVLKKVHTRGFPRHKAFQHIAVYQQQSSFTYLFCLLRFRAIQDSFYRLQKQILRTHTPELRPPRCQSNGKKAKKKLVVLFLSPFLLLPSGFFLPLFLLSLSLPVYVGTSALVAAGTQDEPSSSSLPKNAYKGRREGGEPRNICIQPCCCLLQLLFLLLLAGMSITCGALSPWLVGQLRRRRRGRIKARQEGSSEKRKEHLMTQVKN